MRLLEAASLILLMATVVRSKEDTDTGEQKGTITKGRESRVKQEDPYVALQILVPKALESINRRQDYVQALWQQIQELQQYDPPQNFNQGRFLEWILNLIQNN